MTRSRGGLITKLRLGYDRWGRPRKRPEQVVGDKAYSFQAIGGCCAVRWQPAGPAY